MGLGSARSRVYRRSGGCGRRAEFLTPTSRQAFDWSPAALGVGRVAKHSDTRSAGYAWPGPHRWNLASGVYRQPVASGLPVLPCYAALCHSAHCKLSGVLRSSGFIRKYAQEFKKDVRGLSRGALVALDAYDWPGNVRELKNIIERSMALATRPVIRLDDVPLDSVINEAAGGRGESDTANLTLKDARDRFRAGPRVADARARALESEPHGLPEMRRRAAQSPACRAISS